MRIDEMCRMCMYNQAWTVSLGESQPRCTSEMEDVTEYTRTCGVGADLANANDTLVVRSTGLTMRPRPNIGMVRA